MSSLTIPTATLPSNQSYSSHAQALRNDLISYVEGLAQQGDYLKIPLGFGLKAYFVNDAEAVQEILLKQAKKVEKPGNVKRVAKGVFGENLFTSDGELWQQLRSTLQPAFQAKRLNAQVEMMVDTTESAIASWKIGQVVDLSAAMMDLTLGITTQALFGQDLRHTPAADSLLSFLDLFSELISSFPIPLWIPTPKHLAIKHHFRVMNSYFRTWVAERKRSSQDGDDVLSMLVQAQQADASGRLSDQQICNEVSNLFAAGYEVVAHTLAFSCYLLTQYPDVEARLREELDRVLGDPSKTAARSGRPITAADLPQLSYLERVIKESMRLLPVTTVLSRQVIEEIQLPGGYTLPKGSLVLISPWTLQRRSDYFPDPLQFNPDRFQNPDNIPKFAYLPFSAGPRVCIGNLLAMMQMKVNLAILLQQYRFSIAPNYQFKPIYRFNTRPQGGLPVVIEERSRQGATTIN
ncbi:cytochrome P450 [Leptolyngbya ohadii]|uniref:cytochrome P450 n=1 Tax=Leptolyngbya ohadii TaxID=1962290 RepID=UPI000B59C64D|nr:cytochrome P450 [Leptolyngbya ohadii]